MFAPEVDAAIKQHAMAEWPREACGLVIEETFVPVPNVYHDPADIYADPYDGSRCPMRHGRPMVVWCRPWCTVTVSPDTTMPGPRPATSHAWSAPVFRWGSCLPPTITAPIRCGAATMCSMNRCWAASSRM